LSETWPVFAAIFQYEIKNTKIVEKNMKPFEKPFSIGCNSSKIKRKLQNICKKSNYINKKANVRNNFNTLRLNVPI